MLDEERPQNEHPHDILEVCNIDVSCNDTTHDVLKNTRTYMTPDGAKTEYFESPFEFNHGEFFAVRYEGRVFKLKPGETKLFPRYIAEHIAKALADHLLQKMEVETNRKGLVTSNIERPKMLRRIIVGVRQSFSGEPTEDEGEKAVKLVESLNAPQEDNEPALDLGKVPSKAMGNVKPEPKQTDDILSEIEDEPEPEGETSIYDATKPLPTKRVLIQECLKLDIEVTGNETKEQLVSKLKAFAGA